MTLPLLESIGSLLLLGLLGWLLGRKRFFSREVTAGFSRLLVDVTIPLLIFTKLAEATLSRVPRIFGCCWAAGCLSPRAAFCWPCPWRPGPLRASLDGALLFSAPA